MGPRERFRYPSSHAGATEDVAQFRKRVTQRTSRVRQPFGQVGAEPGLGAHLLEQVTDDTGEHVQRLLGGAFYSPPTENPGAPGGRALTELVEYPCLAAT